MNKKTTIGFIVFCLIGAAATVSAETEIIRGYVKPESEIISDYVKSETIKAKTTKTKVSTKTEIATPPNPALYNFDHDGHVNLGQDCKTCHQNAKTPSNSNAPKMDTCVDCHRKTYKPMTDCSFCHQDINKKTLPMSHTNTWTKEHGIVFEQDANTNCTVCHTEASCQSCHRRNKPQDHTNFFRKKGHGIRASFDRESCMVCHRIDSCVRCHQTGPAIPNNARHNTATTCLTCHATGHFNNGFTSCRTCHR